MLLPIGKDFSHSVQGISDPIHRCDSFGFPKWRGPFTAGDGVEVVYEKCNAFSLWGEVACYDLKIVHPDKPAFCTIGETSPILLLILLCYCRGESGFDKDDGVRDTSFDWIFKGQELLQLAWLAVNRRTTVTHLQNLEWLGVHPETNPNVASIILNEGFVVQSHMALSSKFA